MERRILALKLLQNEAKIETCLAQRDILFDSHQVIVDRPTLCEVPFLYYHTQVFLLLLAVLLL